MHRSRFFLMSLGILFMLGLLFTSSDRASIVLADIATIAPPGDPTTPTPNPVPGGGSSGCGMSSLDDCTCTQLGQMAEIKIDKRIVLQAQWDSFMCDPEPPAGMEDICNTIDTALTAIDGQITAILTEARSRPCAWAH